MDNAGYSEAAVAKLVASALASKADETLAKYISDLSDVIASNEWVIESLRDEADRLSSESSKLSEANAKLLIEKEQLKDMNERLSRQVANLEDLIPEQEF